MCSYTDLLENLLATSVKVKNTYALWLGNLTSDNLSHRNIYKKNLRTRKMSGFGKSREQAKLSYTPGRSVNWYSRLENLFVPVF